jgi:TolB-like protein
VIRAHGSRGASRRIALVVLCAFALASCATGSPMRRSSGGTVPQEHGRAALVPFENLAGQEEQGVLFTRVFFAQLVGTGVFDLVDPSRVEVEMDSLGFRASGSLTPAEIAILADSLGARYVLMGSVLESRRVQSAGEDLPAVGATLRLIEAKTGKVLWAGVHFRSGDDRETLFGWGRVKNPETLIAQLTEEILVDFREAGEAMRKNAASGGKQ